MNIDTLAMAREFRAAEFPPAQAEAIAAAIGHAVTEGAATRSDLNELRLALTGKIDQLGTKLEAKLDARIESLRSTLTLWFVGTGITMAGVIIAAVKL